MLIIVPYEDPGNGNMAFRFFGLSLYYPGETVRQGVWELYTISCVPQTDTVLICRAMKQTLTDIG